MLRCRDLSAASIVRILTVGHFYTAENVHAHYFGHVVEVAFFLVGEEDVLKFREFNLRLLSCLRARFAHNDSISSLCTTKCVNLANMCSK